IIGFALCRVGLFVDECLVWGVLWLDCWLGALGGILHLGRLCRLGLVSVYAGVLSFAGGQAASGLDRGLQSPPGFVSGLICRVGDRVGRVVGFASGLPGQPD